MPEPHALRDAWLATMAEGDEVCPGHPTNLGPPSVDEQGCTASTGWHYAGIATYSEGGWSDGDEGQTWFGLFQGDFAITAPDGSAFVGGGTFAYDGLRQDGESGFQGSVEGTFAWPGGAGWLASEASVALALSGDDTTLVLDGGIDVGTTLAFDELTWGSCPEQPTGTLSIRDPSGWWYALALEACGGCGSLSFGGVDAGEGCVDLAAPGADTLTRLVVP